MYVAMTRARHSLTILASEARPSAFVTELRTDPAYALDAMGAAEVASRSCGECGGRLLSVPAQDGRLWYRCEHVQHCGNFLPACMDCGSALPSRDSGSSEAVCSCGATYPTCPECSDGWLVDRTGPYGCFLGCVRFPVCLGKANDRSQRSLLVPMDETKSRNPLNSGLCIPVVQSPPWVRSRRSADEANVASVRKRTSR